MCSSLPSSTPALQPRRGLKVFNTGHAIQVEWDEIVNSSATIPVLGEHGRRACAASDGRLHGPLTFLPNGCCCGPFLARPRAAPPAAAHAGGEWGAVLEAAPAELSAPNATLRQAPLKPLQIHWHSLASHIRDGEVLPLEMHLVTQVDTSSGDPSIPESCKTEACTAVFGVMVKVREDGGRAPGAAACVRGTGERSRRLSSPAHVLPAKRQCLPPQLNEDAYKNGTDFYSLVLLNVPEKIGAEVSAAACMCAGVPAAAPQRAPLQLCSLPTHAPPALPDRHHSMPHITLMLSWTSSPCSLRTEATFPTAVRGMQRWHAPATRACRRAHRAPHEPASLLPCLQAR